MGSDIHTAPYNSERHFDKLTIVHFDPGEDFRRLRDVETGQRAGEDGEPEEAYKMRVLSLEVDTYDPPTGRTR
jgi:hypothetical protein